MQGKNTNNATSLHNAKILDTISQIFFNKGKNKMPKKQQEPSFKITKDMEKLYRNATITPKQVVITKLELNGRVVGDFIKLAQKHPEYFSNPQEAQKLCQEVLQNAEIGINATDRRFKLIITKLKQGKRDYGGVALRVQNINGEHRIRSVLFMDSKQVKVKIDRAKELGEPILQF